MIRTKCPFCNTKMKSFSRASTENITHVCTNTDCMFTSETLEEHKKCPHCDHTNFIKRTSKSEFSTIPKKTNEVYSLRTSYNKCLNCDRGFSAKNESLALRMGLNN